MAIQWLCINDVANITSGIPLLASSIVVMTGHYCNHCYWLAIDGVFIYFGYCGCVAAIPVTIDTYNGLSHWLLIRYSVRYLFIILTDRSD